ncbi:MAG: hypothetical protein ACLFQK_07710 [Fibrobacterota bacterium]
MPEISIPVKITILMVLFLTVWGVYYILRRLGMPPSFKERQRERAVLRLKKKREEDILGTDGEKTDENEEDENE